MQTSFTSIVSKDYWGLHLEARVKLAFKPQGKVTKA